jgi:uncharacterized membrane protein YedE/YeeE
MLAVISSLLIGTVLGAELAVSQMMNPAKVIGFLDFSGNWDPSLALVMLGAIIAALPGFALARKRSSPLIGDHFQVPTRRDIDARLLAGAVVFGIGWGMSGFCPGPALAALSSGLSAVFAFVAAMVTGMALFAALPGNRRQLKP